MQAGSSLHTSSRGSTRPIPGHRERSLPGLDTVDLTDVLPFAGATATEPGQQTLPFALGDHRTPLPPAAAVSLMGRPFVPEWSDDAAYRCFLLLLPQAGYHGETAYEMLLDSGCPLEMGDRAWNRWVSAAVCA